MAEDVKFRVSPHVIEDFGVSLYSSLPRVVVEYVANAWDANATKAEIAWCQEEAAAARKQVKDEAKAAGKKGTVAELGEKPLPVDLTLSVTDDGHGMTRDELENKFLVAGRRRRKEETSTSMQKRKRPLMGRKGLGKLAGFGAAKLVEVVTRKKGERHATKIELDYDKLVSSISADQAGAGIPVRTTRLTGQHVPFGYGTRIVLSGIHFEQAGVREATVGREVARHFYGIRPEEFIILLNGKQADPARPPLAWAWPEPNLPLDELAEETVASDDGTKYRFRYRLRFVKDKGLPAKERGVRVYAHNRLAAPASLLEADTNVHGFRMTDYLDGVVEADFIDDQERDLIATDRQGLQWESPVLKPLHEFLSAKIKEAVKERQKVRDRETREKAEKDDWTTSRLKEAGMPARQATAMKRLAVTIAGGIDGGCDAEEYRESFGEIVDAVSRGKVLRTLSDLAKKGDPELAHVASEIRELTQDQLDSFYVFCKGRLSGIAALKKIIQDRDFKQKNEEKRLQALLAGSPWLIDPRYFEFLTSDQTEKQVFDTLEKKLGINRHVPANYDPEADDEVLPERANKRPDLVFAMGNRSLGRVVIVELKAANTPLTKAHLDQLELYIEDTRQFLRHNEDANTAVTGILIGSYDPGGKSPQRRLLERWVDENNQSHPALRVKSLDRLISESEETHKGLLDAERLAAGTG